MFSRNHQTTVYLIFSNNLLWGFAQTTAFFSDNCLFFKTTGTTDKQQGQVLFSSGCIPV
jgi:hypothetical protein